MKSLNSFRAGHLGLSLAELFLILVFLLLLALIGYTAAVEEENDQLVNEKEDAVSAAEESASASDELVRQREQEIAELKNLIGDDDPQALISGLQRELDSVKGQLDELTPAAEIGERVSRAADQANIDLMDVPQMLLDQKLPDTALEDARAQLAAAQEQLATAESLVEQLANEKEDAVSAAMESASSSDELARQREQEIAELKNLIGDDDPQALISGLQRELDSVNGQLDELTPAAEIGERVSRAADQANIDLMDVPQMLLDQKLLDTALEDARAQLAAAQEQLATAESQVRDLLERLSALTQEKGQYPPCWYENVARTDGTRRERPLYIFDVQILDDGILVADIPAPTREYQIQKQTLPYERDALDRHLRFDEFVGNFEALKNAGEGSYVQPYPCKFYVKVWAATTSMATYRNGLENVVESVFFTYPVREDPWPH